MLAEIGTFSLTLALAFCCVQVIAFLNGHKNRWKTLGRVATFLQAGFVTSAFFTLLIAFFSCDFSLLLVVFNDHTALPWY